MLLTASSKSHVLIAVVCSCLILTACLGCDDSKTNNPAGPVPSSPQWQQLSGTVTGDIFMDLWGTGNDNLYGVTFLGSIYHYDGAAWTKERDGDGGQLRVVTGSAPNNVWAAGSGGLLHYDGHEWTEMVLPTTQSLWSVDAISPSDVYVGGSGGTLLHYDGSNWSPVEIDGGYFVCGIHKGSSGNLYATVTAAYDNRSKFIRRGAAGWEELFSTTRLLKGMHAVSDSDIYVMGTDDGLWHWDGTSLVSIPLPSYGVVNDLTTMDGTSLVILYNNNRIYSWDNGSWNMMFSTDGLLTSLWGGPGADIYTGGHSIFYHYDGIEWEFGIDGSLTDNNLTGVWCSLDGQAFIVGDSGTILRYDGSEWGSMHSPAAMQLTGIWGASDDDIYAVGNNPDGANWQCAVIHYDGTNWSVWQGPMAGNMTCISGIEADNFYVGGYDSQGHPSVWHFRDGLADLIPANPYTIALLGIWACSDRAVYVVGEGWNRMYDGMEWQQVNDSGFDRFLSDIDGISPSFAVAGGWDQLLRLDGLHWTRSYTDDYADVIGVWAASVGSAYAVGEDGYVFRLSGEDWHLEGTFNQAILRAVHGSSTNDVYVVGDYGTILHYSH